VSTAYVCELCKEVDQDFTVPFDEIGAAVMQQHLASEHHVALLGKLRRCAECTQHVLCTLDSPGPASCREHS